MTTALRSRLAATAATAGLTLAALFGAASPAFAHDDLVDAEILADDSASPEAVRLTFSDSILEVGVEIVVTTPDGGDGSDGPPELDGPQVTQPLAAELPEGSTTVAWRVVSSDGHPIEGVFFIEIAADGTGTVNLRDAAVSEPDPRFAEDESGESPADEVADAVTEEDADGDAGGNPVQIIVLVVLALALVGIIGATIVGQRRRTQAIPEAEPGSDTTAPVDSEEKN